jgi:hypothetical protein
VTALQVSVLLVLAAWLGITVLWNLPGMPPRVARLFARVGLARLTILLPTWNFFAPRPGDADYCLLYRDQEAGGGLTPWKTLALPSVSGLRRAVWNPHSRTRKVIHDAMSHLGRLASPDKHMPRAQLVLSLPYLVLLRRVCREPLQDRTALRQFAVLQYRLKHRAPNPSDFKPVLISYFHRIEAPGGES